MSAFETKDPMDADALKADSADFVARMQRIAKGEEPAQNPTIEYLLSQYKDAQAELEALQRQAATAQESFIRVKGRLDGLEKDLRHWDSVASDKS